MKPSRSPLLARLRQSRKGSLLLFAVTLGTLLVAAIWFTSARNNLAEAYNQVGQRQQALAAAKQQKRKAELRVQLASNATQLVERAAASGYVGQGWGERLINIESAPLTRSEVNHLLSSVSRNHDRMFGATEFELSVTHAAEGLFDKPGPRSPPLLMTLQGTLMFRTQSLPTQLAEVP